MQAELHPIQNQILTLLMQSAESKNYAKLMIPGVENDSFNYHLQQLVKTGYIQKTDGYYQLTSQGVAFVSQLNALGQTQQLFKVSVALMVFRKNRTEILMQERLRNPFIGDITTIAGKVLRGEKITDAAKRKLSEESGLAGDFSFVGVLRKIKRNAEKVILEDTLYHYCVAYDPTGTLIAENEFGRNFWTTTPEAFVLEEQNIDVGEEDLTVWKKIAAGDLSFFYIEQDRIVSKY